MLLFQQPAALLFFLACALPTSPRAATTLTLTLRAETVATIPQQDESGPPLLQLPRHPSLSPDGMQLAFSHQGDLWVAPVATGRAIRLTAHDAYDGRPQWSPDGQWLAFVSNRHGNWDIYRIPAAGGTPQRLSWHSEGEKLYGWIDQDRLLIGAQRDRRYSRRDRGLWIAYSDGRTPTVLGDWAALNASIAQDGKTLVYERGHGDPSRRAYRGSASSALWRYDIATASHHPLSEFDGNDIGPMLSPDGATVFFLSDRVCPGNEEGRDLGLWKIPTRGGRAQLVYHPGGRSLRNASIARNGSAVVAELDLGLVRIALADGKATPLAVFGSIDPSDPVVHDRTVTDGASELAVSPDGESIAFVAAGDIYVMRKNEDIHRCVRVTTHPAPDYSPVWIEDGKALLFVSERDGNAEFYRAEILAPAETAKKEGQKSVQASEKIEEASHPFYLSRKFQLSRLTQTAADETQPQLSPDGKTLAWVVGLGDLVVGDPATATARRTLCTGFEGPDFDWSPDSAWLVYSQSNDDFNYDVFLQRVDIDGLGEDVPGVKPYNLTSHPDDDTRPRWSPDGRRICFTSRRMMLDETDVWVVDLRAEDLERNELERLEAAEAKAKAAEAAKEKEPSSESGDPLLTGTWEGTWVVAAAGPDPEKDAGPSFTLQVFLKDESLQVSVATDFYTGACSNPAWDAETATLSFHLEPPKAPGVDVLIQVQGEKMSGSAFDGTKNFLLRAERTQKTSGLEPEVEKSEVEEVLIDWLDLRRRLVRVTRREANETAIGWSADSSKLYFNASTGTRLTNNTTAESGFFSVELEGKKKEEQVESSPVYDFTRFDKELLYVKDNKVIGNDGKTKTYTFSVRYREDLRAVRDAVVGQVWRALDRMFYDSGFHGHDWSASLTKWAPAARIASTPEDYGEMVNWMLGEMNSSHMGYYNFGTSAARETDAPGVGFLGVLWDESFVGPGRKVAEVLAGTPAARSISRLKVGDVVLDVNGIPYEQGDNWYRLMQGTAGQETELQVLAVDGTQRQLILRSIASLHDALYRRFEDRARAEVEKNSGGRLGYIHIESMSTGPLVEFERKLFAAGAGRDGLLIDVRENGGGWTTDMILAMLMVRDHAITIPRGGGEGYPQGRRVFATWDKPIVVLCNENSYSNAEIFSWAIKTLGRGPLVGKQTYGAVISTGGTSLMDGSFVRLPFRGWYVNDAEHTNMEHHGCMPDYPVENLPGDWVSGVDRQLEKAIEVGLKQL